MIHLNSSLRASMSLLLLCVPLAVNASGLLRCGTKLVQQGMPEREVIRRCGQPQSIEKDGTVWVYDFGPDEFLKVITFVQGEVEFINERPRPDKDEP